jgi:glutamyl/glutaminyl-tRNA synthetase
MGDGPLRTRFAPSPTGSLHVGGARTALYNLLAARQVGGVFVLRIEDTDQVRSTEEASRGIVRDMRWLGLYWDEGPERDHPQYGPYWQSQRLELYTRYARQLLEMGKAYEAWESGEELAAERKEAEAAKQDFRYRRRPYTDEQLERFRAEGRKPVIRFASPARASTIADEILGDVTVEEGDLDDFVIIKADGFPTYHFAVVVDDHHMDISLVTRGQEHLSNTHKHLALYEAFGWTPPRHGHLPSILSPDGDGKMSKRQKAKAARKGAQDAAKAQGKGSSDWSWLSEKAGLPVSDVAAFMAKKNESASLAQRIADALEIPLPMIEVMDFRKEGYLPEALLNYLALVGWSPGDNREILTLQEMTDSFSLDRVNKSGGRFDPEKLTWMNAEYMQRLPDEVLLERLDQWLEVVDSPVRDLDAQRRRYLLAMYRKRAKCFADIGKMGPFLFEAPTSYDPKQVSKHLGAEGRARLAAAREALAALSDWSPEALKAALDGLGEGGINKVAQPVRIALTGTGVGPEIDLSLAFLGKEEVLRRLDAALSAISG